MKDFISIKIRSRQKIRLEFKAAVKECREKLISIHDAVTLGEREGVAEGKLIERYYPLLDEAITSLLKKTDSIADDFTDDEHIIHKDFLRDHLGAFLLPAFLNLRALKKPLGYAGDFQMMNLIYDEDPFKGHTLFDKMVNASACRCISGRLTAKRIPYFLHKFEKLGKTAIDKRGKFRVLDVACGPSREIEEFIRKNPLARQTEFHLIDQDQEAIHFSKTRLEAAKKALGNGICLSFYPQSIKELFMTMTPDRFPAFDLIYSGGLFDYLDDAVFAMAVPFLYGLLAEGGTLIIGNISPEDYSKTVKWYLDDWPLIYRTREELLLFAPADPPPRDVGIETEETGVNLFLVVRK